MSENKIVDDPIVSKFSLTLLRYATRQSLTTKLSNNSFVADMAKLIDEVEKELFRLKALVPTYCGDCNNYDVDERECAVQWTRSKIEPSFYCAFGEKRGGPR
jgi:hypothetical protein